MKLLFPAIVIAISSVILNSPVATAEMALIGSAMRNSDQAAQEAAYLHTWRTVERETISGRIGKDQNYYSTCSDDGRPAVSATANHGTITFRDGVAQVCGRAHPVTELWYQSEPGFHGVDEITVGAPFYQAINITVR